MVTSTCCSCRRPGFYSQHLHSYLQLPITLVPKDLVSSAGLCEYEVYTRSLTYMQEKYSYAKVKINKSLKTI